MRHLKPVLFTFAVLCGAASIATYKLGFELYPPGTYTEAGVYARHDSAFMARCGKARITSLIGDPIGSSDWPRCRRILDRYGTTGQFMLRHNAVAILTGLSLLALIGLSGMLTIIGSGLMLGWLYEGPRRFLARLKRRCVG